MHTNQRIFPTKVHKNSNSSHAYKLYSDMQNLPFSPLLSYFFLWPTKKFIHTPFLHEYYTINNTTVSGKFQSLAVNLSWKLMKPIITISASHQPETFFFHLASKRNINAIGWFNGLGVLMRDEGGKKKQSHPNPSTTYSEGNDKKRIGQWGQQDTTSLDLGSVFMCNIPGQNFYFIFFFQLN